MKSYVNSFCSLALLLAYCCALAAVYTVFATVEGVENADPGLVIWLLCIASCHISLGLYLRRERSVRSVVTIALLFFLLQTLTVFIVYGLFSGFLGTMIALGMWAYTYFCCFEMNTGKLTFEKLSKGFDISALVLMFVLFFCSVKGLSLSLALPLAAATLLCLMALILFRSENASGAKTLILGAALILGAGLVSGVVVLLAAGGIKKLTLFIVESLLALGKFFLHVINEIFLFIMGLFPEVEYELIPEEAVASLPAGDMEGGLLLGDPELVIGIILGLGFIAAGAIVLYKIFFGKSRMKSVSVGGGRGISRSRPGFFSLIKRLLKRFCAKLRFWFLSLVRRNTAQGLFISIERRSRRRLHGRRKSESCREFICRAQQLYPHAKAELEGLADELDRMCYGNSGKLSKNDIVEMRKIILRSAKR